MKIGIVVPTRGLVFSQTMAAIERERQGYETKLYISHDLPIPSGHNELCQQALEDGNDYILIVEEDVVIPAGALEKMLAANAAIACIDYGVSGWSCITRDQTGEILWCGLGCTLIHKSVFEALEKPYFRADMVLKLPEYQWQKLPKEYVEKRNYGSLDIWFCAQAKALGFEIKQVPGECRHLKLDELGKKERNYGVHLISEKPRISQYQMIERR